MAPSVAWKPTSAKPEIVPFPKGICSPTPGFQPVIAPVREANMNTDAPVLVPSVTEKSVELPVPMIGWLMLNTCPVGLPPGMFTLKSWLIGLPLRSPKYNSLRPPLLDDTQNAPAAGAAEMPQALIRVGSRFRATPGWSDTRLICCSRLEADSRERSSSASNVGRQRLGFCGAACFSRLPPRNNFAR